MEAVIVLPPTVEPLIGVPVIDPPVIATLLAFWVDIVPSPETAVFGMAIVVFVALVICPWAFTAMVGTVEAEP